MKLLDIDKDEAIKDRPLTTCTISACGKCDSFQGFWQSLSGRNTVACTYEDDGEERPDCDSCERINLENYEPTRDESRT